MDQDVSGRKSGWENNKETVEKTVEKMGGRPFLTQIGHWRQKGDWLVLIGNSTFIQKSTKVRESMRSSN